MESELAVVRRVGWGFITLYALALMGTSLLFIAPLLVTLALKINSLVGIEQAPSSLGLVTGIGSLLSIVANPFFGKMSDRTTSALGMRRPWMIIGLVGGSVGILIVALAPSVPVVLVGWCIAQLLFNALLAALVAVLPDQVPTDQRGLVSGVLGICLPIASVSGTFVVQLFTGNQLAMFLAPCAIGGIAVLLFVLTLKDRRLARADRPTWSLREFASTFYVNPKAEPRLRLGLRQPVPARAGVRLPDHVPGVLPAEQDRQRGERCAPTDLPGHTRPVHRDHRRLPDRRQALRPGRAAQDLRPRRGHRVRRGDVRRRHRQQLHRVPRRHGASADSASACTSPLILLSSPT